MFFEMSKDIIYSICRVEINCERYLTHIIGLYESYPNIKKDSGVILNDGEFDYIFTKLRDLIDDCPYEEIAESGLVKKINKEIFDS